MLLICVTYDIYHLTNDINNRVIIKIHNSIQKITLNTLKKLKFRWKIYNILRKDNYRTIDLLKIIWKI